MSNSKRSLQVFLCHASSDKSDVQKLYDRLLGDGVDAWLDKEKLIPGQNWQIEISKAVKNSDVVLVCLSRRSINKEGFIQKEIKMALDTADEKPEGTIFVIPVRLENCTVPDRISQFQWVDLFKDDGYKKLIKALQVRAGPIGAALEPPKESQPQTIIDRKESVHYERHPSNHEPTPSKKYEVFLSYSTANKAQATQIHDFLTNKRINVFLAGKENHPSLSWTEVISDALKSSRLFCILISSENLASEWVRNETDSAWALNIPILILLSQCVRSELVGMLQSYQCIDYRDYPMIVDILANIS